ncbi:MAG: nucleotidyltransferase domain-containing protein [Bifidobacterium animalis]|nr:nucleotidyltransferase domain-containing protein [Bifidobacterium animalis]MDY5040954.1 nucleotidyltransferase domain-containing protein [Bifidobacterium animalis]
MKNLTPREIADIAVPLAREYGIDELYLFGSAARGALTDESDVDFIYDLSGSPDRYRRVIDFRHRLTESLGRPVDLIRKEYVSQRKNDEDSELIRRAFMHNLQQYPIYRLL